MKKVFTDDICLCCDEHPPIGPQVCLNCKKEQKKTTENHLKVSESLIIDIDISNGDDIPVMQVARRVGNKCEIINTFYGEEAEWTYEHLINNRHHKITLDYFLKAIQNAKKDSQWRKANPGLEKIMSTNISSIPPNAIRNYGYPDIPQDLKGTTAKQIIIDKLAMKGRETHI